jgi:hypothetical protein
MVKNPQEKRILVKCGPIWKNNIQMELKELWRVGVVQSVQILHNELVDRGSVPGRGNHGMFSLHYLVEIGSGACLASYSMGTGSLTRGGKATGA